MKPILVSQTKLSLPNDRHCGLYTVCGKHAASEPLLQLGACLSLSRTVRILDCGNRADMYQVARALRPLTIDPIAAMNRIRLSRAFTCYQTEALLSSCRALEGTPVLVLDFFSTFMDESVSDDEARRLFHDSAAHLCCLSRRNVVMIGVKPPSASMERRADLLTELTRRSDDFISLSDPVPAIAETGEQLCLLHF